MKLTRLAGTCDDPSLCPAVDLTDRASLIFTGPVVSHEGLRVWRGEQAVELSIDLVKEAMRALDN